MKYSNKTKWLAVISIAALAISVFTIFVFSKQKEVFAHDIWAGVDAESLMLAIQLRRGIMTII